MVIEYTIQRLLGKWSAIQGAPLSQRDPHISGKIGNLGPYSFKGMESQVPIFLGIWYTRLPFMGSPFSYDIYN